MRVLPIVAMLIVCAGLRAAPPPLKTQHSEQRTYQNKQLGFSLSYPSSFQEIPAEQSAEAPFVILFRAKRSVDGAQFYIEIYKALFNLQDLTRFAPTGVEDPPKPVRVSGKTFYFYGVGGGGVNYPSQYFFDLNGSALAFSFDGPYGDEKGLTAEGEAMARRILSTLRVEVE